MTSGRPADAGRPVRLSPDEMYPAGLSHLTARHVRIRSGEALRVIEGGQRASSPIVLVHGWGGSAYSFAELADALVADGHRIVAVDLPGHGLSEPFADPARYTARAMADVVLEVLDEIGAQRVTLVAHSMGGAIALEVARRESTRMDRMVLAAPVGLGRVPLAAVARAVSPRMMTGVAQSMLHRSTIGIVLRHLAFGTADRPTGRDIDEYWAPSQFPHFAAACRECLHQVDWGMASPAALAAIRVPVLVIAGARDRVVRHSDRGGRLIPGARVVTIDDAGHLAIQERAATCFAAMRDFLTRPG